MEAVQAPSPLPGSARGMRAPPKLDCRPVSDILTPVNVMRSQAQEEMVHVLLTNRDVAEILEALRKTKNETARRLRAELKKVK